MVGGFFAGQLLIPMPLVGGVIGTVVGGIAGGVSGAKISLKFYERMEAKMEEYKLSMTQSKEK